MRRIPLVRRRDGETVPFDQHRVRDAIHRALLASGSDDRVLTEEIGCVVEMFLEKTFHDEIPSTEHVEDMVERVLIDTGHAAAAKAFILHRDRRRRMREVRSARDGRFEPTLFDHRVIRVDDAAAGTSAPYSRERLARTLAADGSITRALADEIAAEVESRLRREGVARAPASLVRALADADMLGRAPEVDLRRRGAAVLPAEQLAAALYRKGPQRRGAPFPDVAARDLGGAALRCHALSELLPAAVARAHLDGDLFVHGLERPAALFRAALAASDVVEGRAPGSGPRAPGQVARSARRLSTAFGRSVRYLGGAVVDRVRITDVADSFAPLVAASTREQVNEEAWHLVFEASADLGDTPPELDVTPTDDAAGAAFSAACLRVLTRRDGLPAREHLPVPTVSVTPSMFEIDATRQVLQLAAEAVLDGVPVAFTFDRDDVDDRRPDRAARARVVAGRTTVNLPRAARRVGRGNVEGFLRACDDLVDLAADAHASRRELLGHVAAASGGTLAPLLRSVRGRRPLYELGNAIWSVGVLGLSEALWYLTGFELHEGGEATTRLARRVVGYLDVRVREAGLARDLRLELAGDDDELVATHLFSADLAERPADMTAAFPQRRAYTPGIRVRSDAPVDLLARVATEDPLLDALSHSDGAADGALRLAIAGGDTGGVPGILALLRKLTHVGRARRLEVVAW